MSIAGTLKGIVMGQKKETPRPTQVIEHQHHWVRPPPQPKTFSQKIEALSKKTDKFSRASFKTKTEPKYPAKFKGTINSVEISGDGLSLSEAKQWVTEKIKGEKKETVTRSAPAYVSQRAGRAYQSQQERAGIHYYPEYAPPQQEIILASPRTPSAAEQITKTVRRGVGTGMEFIGKASRATAVASKASPITSRIRQAQESRAGQAIGGAMDWGRQQAEHYKTVVPTTKQIKAVAQKRQQVIAASAGGIMAFAGQGQDPYYSPIKGAKQKLGRRISKMEAKRLQKLFGENWQSKLKQSSKGYYAEPTPADMAQARKERKLASRGVDFGQGFESMRTGMEVSLTSDMGQIPGDRESDDPFNIDARFGRASMSSGLSTPRKTKNKYDINANFNNGGFIL